jgi:hypothetical protein
MTRDGLKMVWFSGAVNDFYLNSRTVLWEERIPQTEANN